MKNKTILISIILIFITMTTTAQTLWINGVVFENNNDTLVSIPYATVILYNYENPDIIERVGITDYTGSYDIGNDVPSKKYHLKIFANGFQKIDKSLTKLPNSHEGNLTLHYEMKRTNKDSSSFPSDVVYIPKQTDKDNDAKTIKDAILQLGNIEFYGENLIDDKQKSIRLFINGQHFPLHLLDKILALPTESVERIVYTKLGENSTIYGGCVNFIVEGRKNVSTILEFKPYVTNQFD